MQREQEEQKGEKLRDGLCAVLLAYSMSGALLLMIFFLVFLVSLFKNGVGPGYGGLSLFFRVSSSREFLSYTSHSAFQLTFTTPYNPHILF